MAGVFAFSLFPFASGGQPSRVLVSIQHSLDALLQPIGLIWATLLLSVVVNLFRGRILACVQPAALAGFIQLIGGTDIPARLVAELERPYDPNVRGWPTRADAVIMLGGTHDYSPRTPLHFGVGEAADRILLACELSRSTGANALVLGGGYYEIQGVRRPDSEPLVEWIKTWHIPVGTVYPLGICANTLEEAERSIRLARERRWTRLVVVTSGYHLKRAEAIFKKLGVSVIPVGAEFLGLDAVESKSSWSVVPRMRGFELMHYWVHEQVGFVYYRMRGWI